MKSVLVWMRNNSLTTASAVVAVLALATLVWLYMLTGSLNERMADRTQVVSRIERLMRNDATVPPESLDQALREFDNVTINQPAVNRLQEVYGQLNEQYKAMFSAAQQHNQRGHQQLMPNLFPDAPESRRFDARDRYLRAFRWMLEPAGETDKRLNLPRLDAGPPLAQERMQQAVERVQAPISLSREDDEGSNDLTQQQQEKLRQRREDALTGVLRNHASNIKLYAFTDAEIFQEAFPFYVRQWSAEGDQPSMAQLWERQLELWIQQDLAQAIANLNADAESVLDAPVKRLINMRVSPGYVGLHTDGAVGQTQQQNSSRQRNSNDLVAAGEGIESEWRGAYPIPPSGWISSGPETPHNFLASPSGRVSNPLYDVRHAVLTVVINYKQLPDLMNELSALNFMTVLNSQIEDIDEYEALRDGYVYLGGDAVRAELVVESVWLRQWTKDLMPTVTKQYLRLDEPPENFQQNPGIPSLETDQ
jgi:hypothetical protein